MAIRYLGDVEIRMSMSHNRSSIRVVARMPRRSFVMNLDTPWGFRMGFTDAPTMYDSIAKSVAETMVKRGIKPPLEYDERGRIVVRRIFQAPCPMQPRKRRKPRY